MLFLYFSSFFSGWPLSYLIKSAFFFFFFLHLAAMEFRDVKPPMPTLRLPEDYCYNPLYFTSDAPTHTKKSAMDAAAAVTPPLDDGHDASHATLPSSTYLHRPLRFVSPSPRNTPQRRRDSVRRSTLTAAPVTSSSMPPTPLQVPRRTSSASAGNASLIKQAHALAQEVAEWQRFQASIEGDGERGTAAESLSGSGTDLHNTTHRPTRAAQLRAHHTSELLEDREEAEHNIFHRPNGRPSSTASLTSSRRRSGATPNSTPRRRHTMAGPATTPRSTKAAELRHRHSLLLMEEMEEVQHLCVEEEGEREEGQQQPQQHHLTSVLPETAAANSRVSARVTKARTLRNAKAAEVQSRNETRHRRKMTDDGQGSRIVRVGVAATPTRRRGSVASVSSRDEMKAAVSKYIDELERKTEEQLADKAPADRNVPVKESADAYDAPAALPAPKQRRRRAEAARVLPAVEQTSEGTARARMRTSSPRRQLSAADAEPLSPEPRPPQSTLSSAAVLHTQVASTAASTDTTALPTPPPKCYQTRQLDTFRDAAQKKQAGSAVVMDKTTASEAALSPATQPPAAIAATLTNSVKVPSAEMHDTHSQRHASTSASSSSSSSSYSSIEFDVATLSRQHSSDALSVSAVPAEHEARVVVMKSPPPPLEEAKDVASVVHDGVSVNTTKKPDPLSLNREDAESLSWREPSARASASPSPSQGPFGFAHRHAPLKALVGVAAHPAPLPSLAMSSQKESTQQGLPSQPASPSRAMGTLADSTPAAKGEARRTQHCTEGTQMHNDAAVSIAARDICGLAHGCQKEYAATIHGTTIAPLNVEKKAAGSSAQPAEAALPVRAARIPQSAVAQYRTSSERSRSSNSKRDGGLVKQRLGKKSRNRLLPTTRATECAYANEEAEATLSRSFASVQSFHSDDDDALLPAATTTAVADAAATQAELLRFYRSASASSADPSKTHAAALYPASALPTPTTVADVDSVAEAEESATLVSTRDGESAHKTATTESSSKRDTARSSVSTASTSADSDDCGNGQLSPPMKEAEAAGQALLERGFNAWLVSLQPASATEADPSALSSAFLVDAVEDSAFLRGALVPFVSGGSEPVRNTPPHELFGSYTGCFAGGSGGLRAWGLPVPPTNHTHATAAWEAREHTASAAAAVVGITASGSPQDAPARIRKDGKAFTMQTSLPPYQPRMEGPVWKDALDTVRLPQLQESNCPAQPAVNAARGAAKEVEETERRVYVVPLMIADVSRLTLPCKAMSKPAATPVEDEATKDKSTEVVESAIANASAVSINSIPSWTARRSPEQSLTGGQKPPQTSRLPARTRAVQPALSSLDEHASTAAAPPPPMQMRTDGISAWTWQRPYTIGAAGQAQGSPSLLPCERGGSARPARHAPPTAKAYSVSDEATKTADLNGTLPADLSRNTSATLACAPLQSTAPAPAAAAAPSLLLQPGDAPTTRPSSSSAPPTQTPLHPSSPSLKPSAAVVDRTTADAAAPRVSVAPTNAAEAEESSIRDERTPSKSFDSASSPRRSDSDARQHSKYALWKARQEAKRQAAETAETAAAPPISSLKAPPAAEQRPAPVTEDATAPAVAAPVVESLASVHVTTAAAAAASSAAVADAASALGSTMHTALGSQSVGGTEAERTPVERSVVGLHCDVSENEMDDGATSKAPLSHAPTPLLLHSPPPPITLEMSAGKRDEVTTAASVVLAVVSETPSRAFSRSDASTRSLSNAAAEWEAAGRAATPVHWIAHAGEGNSPEPTLGGSEAVAAAVQRSENVSDAITVVQLPSKGESVAESPPPSADVTVAQDPLQRSDSDDTRGHLSLPEAPVERNLCVAVEEAAAGDGSCSPERSHSEPASERVTTAAMSHALFSRNSSSFASTPVLCGNSLSTSLARTVGDGASAPPLWPSEKKMEALLQDNSGDKEGAAVEEESVCREGELDETTSGRPQEPLRQCAPVPHGVANAAPVVTVPPRTSRATATDDEVIPSPYRPASPVSNSNFQATPSLPSDNNPWSGCSSPLRVWEVPAVVSSAPSMVEEGLEVFRGIAKSPPSVPLTRVQYVHGDL